MTLTMIAQRRTTMSRWSAWKRRSCGHERHWHVLAGTVALGHSLCAGAVFHAAGAAALLARWNDGADLVANAPVIISTRAGVVAPDITPINCRPESQEPKRNRSRAAQTAHRIDPHHRPVR
jgi:hypothetical protein